LAITQSEELSNAILENRQEMVEALKAIRQEDYEDTASYLQALENTSTFYKQQEAYLIGESQKVIQRNQEFYNEDYLAYDNWNTEKLVNTDNFTVGFNEKLS
jgi:hypothetical protein